MNPPPFRFRRSLLRRRVDNNPLSPLSPSVRVLDSGPCDQIGLNLKDLGCKFALKSSSNIWLLLGVVLKMAPFNLNLLCVLFRLDNYWENWALLIRTSGHIDWTSRAFSRFQSFINFPQHKHHTDGLSLFLSMISFLFHFQS